MEYFSVCVFWRTIFFCVSRFFLGKSFRNLNIYNDNWTVNNKFFSFFSFVSLLWLPLCCNICCLRCMKFSGDGLEDVANSISYWQPLLFYIYGHGNSKSDLIVSSASPSIYHKKNIYSHGYFKFILICYSNLMI